MRYSGSERSFIHHADAVTQVLDRLEQRHERERRRPFRGDESHFLQDQRQLQHVGDAVCLGDDRGSDCAWAIFAPNIGRGAKESEFARRLLAVSNERREQRAGRDKFATQELHPFRLAQRLVVEARRRGCKKLGDRALVDIRVLPEVDGRQMKAEHVDSALQGAQAPASDDAGVGLPQRERDGREVGAEFRCGRIGRTIDDRLTKGDDMVKLTRRLGEARIHSGDGASVGLLAPRGGGIVGRVGELSKLRTHRGEIGGKRQLGAQLVQFVQIVADRPGALEPHRTR